VCSSDLWIHVHVADPTALIPHSHPLSLLSSIRGTSVYLPDHCHAMMPRFLSEKLFNLGTSKLAMTFSALIDSQGDIMDYNVTPSTLHNFKSINYDEADCILSKDNDLIPNDAWILRNLFTDPKPLSKPNISKQTEAELNRLQNVSDLHRKWRLRKGSLNWDKPSMGIKLDRVCTQERSSLWRPIPVDRKDVPSIGFSPNSSLASPSRRLIEECMILAGRVSALFCESRGIPVLYRGQKSLESVPFVPKKIVDLVRTCKETMSLVPLSTLFTLIPFMGKAYVSTRPVSHYSMGLDGGYSHVTSPLRRYPDMIAHYNIKAWLLGLRDQSQSKFPFSLTDLETEGSKWVNKSSIAKMMSNVTETYFTLEWLRRREAAWAGNGKVSNVMGLGARKRNGIPKRVSYWLSPRESKISPPLNYTAMVSSVTDKQVRVILPDVRCIHARLICDMDSIVHSAVGDILNVEILEVDPEMLTLVVKKHEA